MKNIKHYLLNNNSSSSNEPFLRELIWKTLYDMVRNTELSVIPYSNLVLFGLQSETDQHILRHLTSKLESIKSYLPNNNSVDQKNLNSFITRTEKVLWNKLENAEAKSEKQKIWFSSYRRFANSKKELDKLHSILYGKIKLSGYKIDQDLRWHIIFKLSKYNYPNITKIISNEENLDSSAKGKKLAMATTASLPIWKTKIEWINKLKSKTSNLSFDQFRKIARSLFPRSQKSLREKYSQIFIKDLKTVLKNNNVHQEKAFARSLSFTNCQEKPELSFTKFLDGNPNLKPATSKALKISRQESQRCRKIKAFAKKPSFAF